MTALVLDSPDAGVRGTAAPRLRSTLLGVCMALGAVLFIAAQALFLHLGSSAAAAVTGVAAHRNQHLASLLCDTLGSAGLMAIGAGLWRLVPTGRGSAWVTTGGLLLVVGGLSNALGGAVNGYLLWFATAPGVTGGAAVVDASTHANALATLPISFLAVIVISLGSLVGGVGLLRSTSVPRALAIAWLVSVLLLAAAGIGTQALLIGAPFVVTTALLARRVAASA